MRPILRTPAVLLMACVTLNADAQDPTPQARLKAAFGGPALEAIERFDYRLTVTDAQGQTLRDGRYVLLPGSRRLHVHDTLSAEQPQVWSGEDGTWRRIGAQWEFLGPTSTTTYRQQVAYHFLPLLRDPATQYQTIAKDRLRLSPMAAPAFEVQLEPATGRIIANHFGSGTMARELDYRTVDGLWWPMTFEVVDAAGALTRRGRFSDVAVVAQTTLPAMPVTATERILAAAHSDVARVLGAGWLSSAHNDYNLSLDAAERVLVFARSQPHFEHSHIWLARREGEGWSEPARVPFSDPRYRDSDPWLTPDGRTLYFISNRPVQGDTPRKDLDIWRVAIDAGGFGTPEHLAALASDGEELGPELHDGWLYFNSTRKDGPKAMAIYRARLYGDRVQAPQPLGAPFNAGEQQGDFTLSPDGRTALFWSRRDGSKDVDLFAARREGETWSPAVRLPGPINAPGFDFTPAFSADGQTLRLASMRKPAWLDDATHVFNGQANLYVVPAALVEQAFAQKSP